MTTASVDALADTLAELLGAQRDACNQLLEIGQREREAMLERDDARLAALVGEQQQLNESLGRLEDARLAVAADWARENGLSSEALRLADVIDRCGEPLAATLSALKSSVLTMARELAHVNRGNSLLARASLNHVTALLTARAGMPGAGAAYRRDGRAAAADHSLRLMDRNA
ncbi:MAG: flagellar protein FlgN [Chloroflexi bacterium]|nr:flagellar protein FlgN [Chloroflexota bacterium]